jgi:sialidase-1
MHAAEGLTLAGQGETVIPQLVKRLEKTTDPQQRCGVARELVRAGQRKFLPVLLETLADPDSSGRVHAAESLFKVGACGDGQALRAALQQTDEPSLRLMAAAALARGGNPQAKNALRQALTAEVESEVRLGAWALGRVGEATDRKRLQHCLSSRRQGWKVITEAVIHHALAALGDDASQRQLVANLSATDPAVRTSAATFASDARLTSAAPNLEAMLEDPVEDVRIRAATALLVLALPPRDPDEDIGRMVYEATAVNPRYTEGSIVDLADGTLLFAITEFSGGGSDFSAARIVARRSSDGGRTWSAPRVLQENVGGLNVMSVTLRRLGPPHRWDAPLGMFYLVKHGTDSLDVFLRISDDQGMTFGEPVRMNQRSGYHVMNNDRVIRLSNGRLLAPIAYTEDVRRSNHFVSYCLISDDDGKTWHRGPGQVDQPQRGAMEPGLVELRDGRVMMIVRTQLGGIAAAYSTDQGETWGEPFSLDVVAPEAPSTIGRIPATRDLLLIWNRTYDPQAGHGGERTPLTAAVSSDEGKTWRHFRDLETRPDRGYAYTSLRFVGSRALLSYWEHDRRAQRLSTRFRSLPVRWFYEADQAAGDADAQEDAPDLN